MSLHVEYQWEHQLLNLARDALNTYARERHFHGDKQVLAAAYNYCDSLTRSNSRTFYLASAFLPPEKRQAVRALYAFCRVTDNIVDNAESLDHRQEQLHLWQARVMAEHQPASDPVALAWADTRARYNIPDGYVKQLIDGVARDLYQRHYETFDDLTEYAYGVASTVGLMSMHIIGFSSEDALPYAVKLGVALQMTNILRDVAEDWYAGRLYLPRAELEAYGLDATDLDRASLSDHWREFMRFQINRNRKLYRDASHGIAMLHRDGRFAVTAASELYQAILRDIEACDFQVFDRRARLGLMDKLTLLPGIWWRSYRIRSPQVREPVAS